MKGESSRSFPGACQLQTTSVHAPSLLTFHSPRFLLRDPWTVAGLALLGVLTLLTLLLYRSAPQSVVEASTESWLAARPLAADSVAAESAWRARSLAEDGVERTAATTLWGEAILAWAEILRRQGTGAGLRPDDDETLRRARALVDRALAVALPAALRQRAVALRAEIDRELRLGPLEWLPGSR